MKMWWTGVKLHFYNTSVTSVTIVTSMTMWWSWVKLHNLITQVSSIWHHHCIFPVPTGKMSSRLCYSGRILLQIILLGFFLHFFGLPAIERFQAKKVKDDTCILFESESNIFLSIISLRKIHVQTLQKGLCYCFPWLCLFLAVYMQTS